MRRRIAEEPPSRLALWSQRLVLFSLAVVLLAIVIARAGLLDTVPVVVTLGAGLALSVLGILVAFLAFAVIWHTGASGFGRAVSAIALGLVILAYPAYLAATTWKLPPITDITTDALDPPRYEAIAQLRTRAANPVMYAGLYAAELQRSAYPDIEPLMLDAPPEAVYRAALKLVEKRKWKVVNARPPVTMRRDGFIEAVALTPVMTFRDDVALRFRAIGAGTRVDMRSSSRYGDRDLGINAARVTHFLEDLDTLAAGIKPEPPPKPAEPARRGQARR